MISFCEMELGVKVKDDLPSDCVLDPNLLQGSRLRLLEQESKLPNWSPKFTSGCNLSSFEYYSLFIPNNL